MPTHRTWRWPTTRCTSDPTPAAESYLSIERILAAARESGAEAIHPGYGFLSERAAFARAVVEAGLVFIGPTAEVMDAMGRKDRARAIAEKAGVPVTPQFEHRRGAGRRVPRAGQGRGGRRRQGDAHRRVRPEDSARPSRPPSGRRPSAFGDDTLLVEKYVEAGRHVEVQVFGDSAGNVVHLFERDCSVQRRHQKVVEEAPAPGLPDELRAHAARRRRSPCAARSATPAPGRSSSWSPTDGRTSWR